MDVNDYNKLIDSLAGLRVNLRNLDLQIVRDDIEEKQAVSVSLDAKLVEYSSRELTIDVPFSIESHSADEKDEVVFTMSFSFRLQYRLDGNLELNDGIVDEFIARNVPLNIWPYARELVSSLTSRMGLTPLWLQPLRIER